MKLTGFQSKIFCTLAIIALGFSGCTEKEIPVLPHTPGEITLSKVIIGSDYGTQLYFNLSSNEVVSSNENYVWDIAFNVSDSKTFARINSSKFMSAAKTSHPIYNQILSLEELNTFEFNYDDGTGIVENSPIGDLNDGSELLIIDLGYDADNNVIGQLRLQVDSVTTDGYYFRYGDLDLTYDSIVFISRDLEREWVHFSFINHETLLLEPKIGDYDLLFTRYTEILNDTIGYQVVGVLSPPSGMYISDNPQHTFEEIKTADWDTLSFTPFWNEIGYDWKFYDFDAEEYSVDSERCFAILCSDGREFVMRFIDFYDEVGNRGTVTLESVER